MKIKNKVLKFSVLSLFDGMSGGRAALEEVRPIWCKIFDVDDIDITYYSSEIDKYAILVADKNWPSNIKLGDVTNWRKWDIDWGSIDLLLGGSPCQGFSFAGKQLNFNDPRSKLFFEYVDILHQIQSQNPNVKFLLENVKMKQEYEDVISDLLKVKPLYANSNLISAQNRKRLYWANWKLKLPKDKGILLKDIVHENNIALEEKSATIKNQYFKSSNANFIRSGSYHATGVFVPNFNVNPSGRGMNGTVRCVNNDKSRAITLEKGEGQKISIPIDKYIVPFNKTLKILDKEVEEGKIGYFRKDSQANRVYFIHGKSVTLCGDAGGGAAKMGQYLFGCITPDRVDKRQEVQRFNGGKKFYTLTAQDQHGVLIEGYIRKLTPIECERLQTFPDNYTLCDGVSNTQRYKMLGNGWTRDMIVNFLETINLKNNEKHFVQGELF